MTRDDAAGCLALLLGVVAVADCETCSTVQSINGKLDTIAAAAKACQQQLRAAPTPPVVPQQPPSPVTPQ